MAEINRCEATVSDQTGWHRLRCSRKGRVERNGHWYCKTHDPEYIKQKQEKKNEKYEKDWNERRAMLKAYQACAKINPDNPMVVAESINDMYEAIKMRPEVLVHKDPQGKEWIKIDYQDFAKWDIAMQEAIKKAGG